MRSLLYPVPDLPVGEPPTGFAAVELPLPQGGSSLLWFHEVPAPPAVLLYFHGNGENLETLKWSGQLSRLAALGSVVVVEYPGYGPTVGPPSEERLKAAATSALTWVRDRFPNRSVVVMGWSLGAAVAIHLAATRPDDIAGLVAMSAWTSLPAVARMHFPGWLVALGLGESYDSLSLAPAIDCPALVVHGDADSIIPIAQGERLAAALSTAHWVAVASAGHNDLLATESVWQEIDAFLLRLRPSRPM